MTDKEIKEILDSVKHLDGMIIVLMLFSIFVGIFLAFIGGQLYWGCKAIGGT